MALALHSSFGFGWSMNRAHECLAFYTKVACTSANNTARRRCGGSSAFDAQAYNAQNVPPRVAFLIVGDVRNFNESYRSFRQYVVDSFAAHADSRVFLVLKNAENLELTGIRQLLRPAAMLLEDASDASKRTLQLREPRCHPWNRGGASLSWQTVNFWGAMESAWKLVTGYEAMRPREARFDRVVLSRPDLSFVTGFGPWCGYRNDTWYMGDDVAPDMFWVLPRAHAELALTRSLRTLVECTHGQPCCNASRHTIQGRSTWMTEYWSAFGGLNVAHNALLGQAILARNPSKKQAANHSRSRDRNRDCTLHVGCWRFGQFSEELQRG